MRVNKSPNRLIFLLIVVFIATIFLFSKLGRRAPRLETEWLQISYENISCKSFFDEWKAEIPALVIDSDFLNNLNQPNCGRKENTPTKIGIDAKYKSFELTVDRNFFEVIFYKNNASKDYLDFDVDGRRIIPKRFITRRIGNLEVPTEIGKFVEFWKRSKFIDCVGLKIQRDESEPVDMPGQSSSDVLARLRDELIDNKMFPFLSSGTFLGWFRECSTIPHTSDMDLAVYYDNYNPKYLEKLINGETKFRIVRKLGMDGTKYKWSNPVYDPWCAAELHGHLFWVSCTPESKIIFEFGRNWYLDKPTSLYAWNSASENVQPYGKFTEEEMKEAYILYY